MPVNTLDEYTCLPYYVDTGLGKASGQEPPVPEVILCFVLLPKDYKGENFPSNTSLANNVCSPFVSWT